MCQTQRVENREEPVDEKHACRPRREKSGLNQGEITAGRSASQASFARGALVPLEILALAVATCTKSAHPRSACKLERAGLSRNAPTTASMAHSHLLGWRCGGTRK